MTFIKIIRNKICKNNSLTEKPNQKNQQNKILYRMRLKIQQSLRSICVYNSKMPNKPNEE